jgi:FMN reductase
MTSGIDTVGIVVGNPKPRSRTREVAEAVAAAAAAAVGLDDAERFVIDLAEFGPLLFDSSSTRVRSAVERIAACPLVVVASPTYKASYTGILKLFLDQFATGSLAGVVAFPVMLGGAWLHALAPEVFLKPVLVELGATCPVRGLYLLDSDYHDPPGLDDWVRDARRFLT